MSQEIRVLSDKLPGEIQNTNTTAGSIWKSFPCAIAFSLCLSCRSFHVCINRCSPIPLCPQKFGNKVARNRESLLREPSALHHVSPQHSTGTALMPARGQWGKAGDNSQTTPTAGKPEIDRWANWLYRNGECSWTLGQTGQITPKYPFKSLKQFNWGKC